MPIHRHHRQGSQPLYRPVVRPLIPSVTSCSAPRLPPPTATVTGHYHSHHCRNRHRQYHRHRCHHRRRLHRHQHPFSNPGCHNPPTTPPPHTLPSLRRSLSQCQRRFLKPLQQQVPPPPPVTTINIYYLLLINKYYLSHDHALVVSSSFPFLVLSFPYHSFVCMFVRLFCSFVCLFVCFLFIRVCA